MLDLDYKEDSTAEVDLNVVMTSGGRLVEVQGTAEGQPFDRAQLDRLLELGAHGHAAHRGRAAAGGRRAPMSRLRAVLATGNAGKAAELSRLLGADVEAQADRGRRGRRTPTPATRCSRRAPRSRSRGGRIGLGDDSGIEVAALGRRAGPALGALDGP